MTCPPKMLDRTTRSAVTLLFQAWRPWRVPRHRSASRLAGAGVESGVVIVFRNGITDGALKQQC